MKKGSVLANLLLASTLFWAVPTAEADNVILKVPVDITTYCHHKFPAMREDTLSWDRPVPDETAGKVIDFYGSCDSDPLGRDEIRAQKRKIGDGD
jgi:hypothetical protein